MKNSLLGGQADAVFTYGRENDAVLVGDWDGDGKDTFAVRRGNAYHVKNSLRGGDADVVFTYGRSGDVVLVGAEAVYTVTDPPLKALRKVIPPLRLGGIALDLAFIVLFIGLSLLISVLSRLALTV